MADNSYSKILKSTSIVGGAKFVVLLLGLIKVKIAAVLLGPVGVGLLGIFQSVIDFARNSAGLGVPVSGVKVLASKSGDQLELEKSIISLRIISISSSLLAAIFIFAYGEVIITSSFDIEGSYNIKLLSIAVLFTNLTAFKLAEIQALRFLKLLATAQILGAFFSTISVVIIFYVCSFDGIVYSLISTSIIMYLFSLCYARKKIKVKITFVDLISFKSHAKEMISLGMYMTFNLTLSIITLYAVRYYIASKGSLDDVGFFQAVFTITTGYFGLLLSAMMTDFFPRISQEKTDENINLKTNEQATITILFGGPILALLTMFSPLVLSFLYSSEFLTANELLRWRLYSVLFTLVSWPVGVIALAKGKGHYSSVNDIFSSILTLISIYVLWERIGLLSTSIAYVVSSIFSIGIISFFAYKVSGFSYQRDYINKVIVNVAVLTAINLIFNIELEAILQYSLVSVLVIILLVYSYNSFRKIIK
ncbi:oligosaccharide flippase family protein [Vibrio alginolyticus]|nr:oligosaccharide flippase family protein [Vibrio alginolyticus]